MEQTRKRSKKRDAILSCLCSTDTHPSAEWIYHRLKPQIPDLSLATVYRNLALFKREGRIVSVGIVQNLERFDANTQPHALYLHPMRLRPGSTGPASAPGSGAGGQAGHSRAGAPLHPLL